MENKELSTIPASKKVAKEVAQPIRADNSQNAKIKEHLKKKFYARTLGFPSFVEILYKY